MKKYLITTGYILLLLTLFKSMTYAEDGYKLWLKYAKFENSYDRIYMEDILSDIQIIDNSPTASVIENELNLASEGLLGKTPNFSFSHGKKQGLVIVCKPENLPSNHNSLVQTMATLGPEGFVITKLNNNKNNQLLIAANSPVGALYGTFHLLRLLQIGFTGDIFPIIEVPKVTYRLLNHWDNLDRTVERGYAGFSIWDWHKLPGYIDQRYIDYARANASIGINGTVLTNVNANALVLSPPYLKKVKALADVFRPYGIKVFLTARFSAPIEQGGLQTADPLAPEVQEWWKNKAKEIYDSIPDFGGFLVKANSEGQPGPQDYNRTHAEGANMLADAVAPYGGIVMWRAFVYSHEAPDDRAKQANNEFEPLDGKFRENVVIQVKNGPIDFQPREPFHPLFGAMKETALAMEFQITQEYLGQGTSLAYLAPMWKECLEADTYRPVTGSTVAKIVDGSAYNNSISVMAGVSNIGNDINWTGHPLSQANWYAFGRLAWNHELDAGQIAEEWIKTTLGSDLKMIYTLKNIMLQSHQMVVNYMTPLGLHHIMGRSHHYGPGPWVVGGRADWTSPYYHKAAKDGLGFDRTASGSNALEQYAPEIADKYSDPATCPEKYLLWFHHLPWDYTTKTGFSLWDALCYNYDTGVKQVKKMGKDWQSLKGSIDDQVFRQVSQLMEIQYEEARWWRSACLLYFQQYSGLPFPDNILQPEGSLEEYEQMRFPYAPGIRPTW